MIRDLGKIWSILTPAERRKSVWMLVLVALMALAETGGVLSIMPFLSVLGRPAVIHQNHWLQLAYDRFGFHDVRCCFFALVFASLVLMVDSSILKALTLHALDRPLHFLRHSIGTQPLSRPYYFAPT